MQDTEPSRRPGAGRDGYASLKMHPFFNGVDWKNLRSQTPPKLAMEAMVWLQLCFNSLSLSLSFFVPLFSSKSNFCCRFAEFGKRTPPK